MASAVSSRSGSMSCRAESQAGQLGEREQVDEQLAGELDAARADEGDRGHGGHPARLRRIRARPRALHVRICTFRRARGMAGRRAFAVVRGGTIAACPHHEPLSRRCVGPTARRPSSTSSRRPGRSTSADLAERFGVSQATLRRDLQILEEQRLLRRTHGGALAQDVLYELPVRYRHAQHRDQKRRIAAEVVTRIPEGPVAIGLTGGTTTSEVARLLVERTDLTVVTNALNIAAELALRPRLKLVVTGGVARSQSYELVGPWAEHTLRGVNVGPRRHRRRRHQRRGRPDHARRGRGAHQRDPDRAGRRAPSWWPTARRSAGCCSPGSRASPRSTSWSPTTRSTRSRCRRCGPRGSP